MTARERERELEHREGVGGRKEESEDRRRLSAALGEREKEGGREICREGEPLQLVSQ